MALARGRTTPLRVAAPSVDPAAPTQAPPTQAVHSRRNPRQPVVPRCPRSPFFVTPSPPSPSGPPAGPPTVPLPPSRGPPAPVVQHAVLLVQRRGLGVGGRRAVGVGQQALDGRQQRADVVDRGPLVLRGSTCAAPPVCVQSSRAGRKKGVGTKRGKRAGMTMPRPRGPGPGGVHGAELSALGNQGWGGRAACQHTVWYRWQVA